MKPHELNDWMFVAQHVDHAANRLASLLERLPPSTRDYLQRRTADSGGAPGRAVKAMVRLSVALNDFAAASVVDDADWYRGPYASGPYSVVPDDRPQ